MVALLLLGLVITPGKSAELNPILSAWLDAHGKLSTWSADLVQTRHLAALAQPLVATGKVFYARPGVFRWELGQPPETIAIRSTNTLLMIYPQLDRAECYGIAQGKGGPLRDALTLMEAGFPKDEDSLRKRYSISTAQGTDGLATIVLRPKSSAAKRLVTQISLTFQTNVFTLQSSEIEFADGSRLANQFTESVSNHALAPDLFSTNLPPDITVVEPLQR